MIIGIIMAVVLMVVLIIIKYCKQICYYYHKNPFFRAQALQSVFDLPQSLGPITETKQIKKMKPKHVETNSLFLVCGLCQVLRGVAFGHETTCPPSRSETTEVNLIAMEFPCVRVRKLNLRKGTTVTVISSPY